MNPTALDHTLVTLLLVAVPLYTSHSYARFRGRVQKEGSRARVRGYWQGMVRQWIVTAAILMLWLQAGRTLPALGLTVPSGLPTIIGAATTFALIAFLVVQWRAIRGLDPATLAGLSSQTDGVAELLPRSPREASIFRGLAFTAGTCEEVVYRGYLIAYFSTFMGTWTAALLAGAAFGLGHLYQGRSGIVKTGVIGIGAGLLYVGTGSLLWPMLVHFAIDVHGGAVGRKILEAVERTEEPVPA